MEELVFPRAGDNRRQREMSCDDSRPERNDVSRSELEAARRRDLDDLGDRLDGQIEVELTPLSEGDHDVADRLRPEPAPPGRSRERDPPRKRARPPGGGLA